MYVHPNTTYDNRRSLWSGCLCCRCCKLSRDPLSTTRSCDHRLILCLLSSYTSLCFHQLRSQPLSSLMYRYVTGWRLFCRICPLLNDTNYLSSIQYFINRLYILISWIIGIIKYNFRSNPCQTERCIWPAAFFKKCRTPR